MKDGEIRVELEAMAHMKGMEGCAVVDVDTGMVWYAAGHHDNIPQLAEAAVDYWRLYERHRKHLHYMGELNAQVLMHSCGRITIVSCGRQALLIALSTERESVDWHAWKKRVKVLKALQETR